MRFAHALMLIVIFSCSSSFTEAEPKPIEVEADGQLLAADGKPPYGVFDVTAPDGQVYREVIRKDGTFSSTAADGSAVEGVWEQREAGVFCSKPVQAPRFRCKYEEVDEKGVWTSTEIDGGEVSTVRRLER